MRAVGAGDWAPTTNETGFKAHADIQTGPEDGQATIRGLPSDDGAILIFLEKTRVKLRMARHCVDKHKRPQTTHHRFMQCRSAPPLLEQAFCPLPPA